MRNDIIETISYKGFDIDIYADGCIESPRQWDNLGTMYYKHRNYVLGDIEIDKEFSDIDEYLKFINSDEIAIALPLYIYDHGGVVMNCKGYSCPWDSSQIGHITITKDKIREKYNVKRISKKLLNIVRLQLINEVETFSDYISGNVYCYNWEHGGCSGYYGLNWDYMISEAKSEIDHYLNQQRKSKQDKLKELIKNHVPLDKRVSILDQYGSRL